MVPGLVANLHPGIANVPGRDPETQAVVESLLERDRENHHCFFNLQGFHNHLSHHLLAVYDLGAPAALLHAIYDKECSIQKPIDGDQSEQVKLTPDNFTKYLGEARYYHAFLTFFTEQVKESGTSRTLESYVFDPAVNIDGIQMMARFMSGLYHPFIQTGYGVEFGSDAMVAQGLAQAAVHSPLVSDVLDPPPPSTKGDTISNIVSDEEKPLLHVFRSLYDTDALKPVPYDPEKTVMQYLLDTKKDGRPEEIRKLCATWWGSESSEIQASNLDTKVEELFWITALLLVGTGRQGYKPRMDFVLVHVLNATLFLPSLLKIIPDRTSKVKLLNAFLAVTMMYVLARGRPNIDACLAMSYTDVPHPPRWQSAALVYSSGVVGDPNKTYNPWLNICASSIHAPDAHTVKAIRTLYYAAQQYGHKKALSLAGCFIDKEDNETFPGISKMDGTLFIRAAGVLMDTLGWVTHGEDPGRWDFSGLGWDEAWEIKT